MRRAFPLLLLTLLVGSSFADRPITITILHTNDLHAHMDGAVIRKLTYGGYARQATLIERFRKTDPNVLLLSAGDTFQGTLYFNVYEGLADLAIMNAMGYQAACLGNHEFDRGPAVLANFVKNASFPIVCANYDFSTEPALKGLVSPSTVLTVGGEKVGIVGALTPDMPTISSPGPNIKSLDLVPSVQTSVDDLKRQGINKIIVVSHVGYDEEQQMASKLHDVALIVGGHSHTPLGTPDLPGWPKSRGPYPTIVKDAQGRNVYVVQSWEWGKVLGHLKIDFDSDGRVKRVYDAAPIVIDSSVPEDPVIKSEMAAFQKPLLALQNQPVGETKVLLNQHGEGNGESLIADVISDAMLDATRKAGAVAAFVNSGGVRSSLEPGKITYGQAITVQPFNNTLTVLDLTGDEFKRALEEGADKTGGLLNPSHGTSYAIDFSKPVGSRVSDVVVNGEPLDLSKTYTFGFLNFTAGGGDAHDVLKNAPGKRIDTGFLDIDALVDYIKRNSPLSPTLEGRLTVK